MFIFEGTHILELFFHSKRIGAMKSDHLDVCNIAPDKAAYCVFTQFRGPENAIKFISVCTKAQ